MKISILTIGVVFASTALAQAPLEPPPPPPLPPPGEAGAMGQVFLGNAPGPVTIISNEFTFIGRPVAGAPYSADETTESVQTLADGNRIVNSTTAHVYRDGQGRVRHETTLPALGPNAPVPPQLVTISDPVAGVTYTLDPMRKVAHQMPTHNPDFAPSVKAKMLTNASPGGDVLFSTGTFSTGGRAQVTKLAVSSEDLGTQEMEGVNAQGTRRTETIPAGAIGNEKPLVVTSDRWFSPDLQITLKSVRNDPRMGQTSVTVSNLNRSEPDPSLFQVPPDYTIEKDKALPPPNVEYRKIQ